MKKLVIGFLMVLMLASFAFAQDYIDPRANNFGRVGRINRAYGIGYFYDVWLGTGLTFEGSTVDAYETSILVVDPTANRIWTFPDVTDTVVGKATTDTLTNKTLTSPVLTAPALGAATGTSLALGGGTAITNITVYAPTLTPAATAAAIQTVEQAFTVTGLAITDKVIVNGPAPTSLCPPVTFRVSAANTLSIGFTTLTAVACTPAAGTYNIIAIRN